MGTPPVISGGSAEEALKLFNQQYWEISSLEIIGGSRYGVYVSGNTPNASINHIYLRNLNVHGATYTSTKRADSGEVFISTNAAGQILNDVLIDGVTAHNSQVSEGIFVSAGGAWIEGKEVSQPLGNNITVQNSTVHDIYGDGILISELNHGLLQMNVVYKSGLCPNCTGSTPVGLWEWYCHTCTVQNNEAYANQSWGGDGGDFDIDYYNNSNVVQYNYGHDSAGYCVAFFGPAGGLVSTTFSGTTCVPITVREATCRSKERSSFIPGIKVHWTECRSTIIRSTLTPPPMRPLSAPTMRLTQVAPHAFSRTTSSTPRSRT
jgi:hypothetical protein